MERLYLMIGLSIVILVFGMYLIFRSFRHRREDVYPYASFRNQNAQLTANEIQKKDGILLVSGILACVFAFIQMLIALASNIPAPLVTAAASPEAGMVSVTIDRRNYPFGTIFYRVNQGEITEYTGEFLVFPQDTVTAYTSFVCWSSGFAEHIPQTPAVTIRTVITEDETGNILLTQEGISGDEKRMQIPLSWLDPDVDIKIIDVGGMVRLTISVQDLRRLFNTEIQDELTVAVVIEGPGNPRGAVDVVLTTNGCSIVTPLQDMLLYLPHQEEDPSETVAQQIRGNGFEPDDYSVIPGSVADAETIAIPLSAGDRVRVVSRSVWFLDGPFSDETDEAVRFVGSHEILHGIGESRFRPQADMNRASLVTALYNLAGNPQVESKEASYTDVPENIWYKKAVIWAADNGIAIGVDNSRFSPGAPVTMEQLALMFWRYAGKPEVPKQDDSDGDSSDERTAWSWIVQAGITTDTGSDARQPEDSITREDAAVLLMRLCMWFVGMEMR